MGILGSLFSQPKEQPTGAVAPKQGNSEGILSLIFGPDAQGVQPPMSATPATQPGGGGAIDATLDAVALAEGGWANHPDDQGGPTNHGITLHLYQKLRGKNKDISDLKKITKADARGMIEDVFVKEPGFDKLPVSLLPMTVAFSVTSGEGDAVKVLQKLAGVKVDGVMGSNTLAAIDNAGITPEELKTAVDSFYKNLAKKDPSQKTFIDGWLNRSERMYQLTKELMQKEAP